MRIFEFGHIKKTVYICITTQNNIKMKSKIKFVKADEGKHLIGFVQIRKGKAFGVKRSKTEPMMICVLSEENVKKYNVKVNHLYEVELKKMKNGKGFIVTSAIEAEHPATVTVNYHPKCVYQVIVRFGNCEMIYDPINGNELEKSYWGTLKALNKRNDIKHRKVAVEEFEKAAEELKRLIRKEGKYYV